jgi:acyl-CoA thioesterase
MGELEAALTLRADGDGVWRGRADPAFEANNGMYGGMTAALLLKAVLSEATREGSAASLNVNFMRVVTPGSDIVIRTRRMGATRSLQTWTAELAVADETCAIASVVTAQRRDSAGFVQPVMPDVSAPDGIAEFYPPNGFGRRSPVRAVLGGDFTKGSPLGRTHSATWVRELSGRPIDAVQIAYLCDNYAPRTLYMDTGMRASSTVIYSVYFLATDAELAAVGDDYTLIDVIGTRAAQAAVGSRANLWSRDGVLLATTEQLCWYRS